MQVLTTKHAIAAARKTAASNWSSNEAGRRILELQNEEAARKAGEGVSYRHGEGHVLTPEASTTTFQNFIVLLLAEWYPWRQ